jgi:dihydrodipicolinate synthase/N-acetylneuraminate lyase
MSARERLLAGVAIPAHPLALGPDGAFDETAQRALTRYYVAAGADGLAVGVHTTQFDLHKDFGLFGDVLRLAGVDGPLLIAGVIGDVSQAVGEAKLAADAGYDAVLLCPLRTTPEKLLDRARAVGEILPTIGFALQTAVGGVALPKSYWSRLFDLESVIGVKAAPFDRYRTNDIARALLEHDRWDQVALLTGNDDTIVADLITPYRNGSRELRMSGGLLGQWAVGTKAAVSLLRKASTGVDADLLAAGADLVEVNAAVFDVANGFGGCVAGVNEVLRQQGLLRSSRCLSEELSPGQAELITHVRQRFPELLDEDFVAEHRDDWLG